MTGKCYLVGAGPGDPGLLTVKGRECLAKADVLIYDALSSAEFLRWVSGDCEKIYAGKRAADHAIPQEGINALIVEKAREGKTVVRLKGGDPMIFGRGGEEAAELAAAEVPSRALAARWRHALHQSKRTRDESLPARVTSGPVVSSLLASMLLAWGSFLRSSQDVVG